jgi:hypothetical protein
LIDRAATVAAISLVPDADATTARRVGGEALSPCFAAVNGVEGARFTRL